MISDSKALCQGYHLVRALWASTRLRKQPDYHSPFIWALQSIKKCQEVWKALLELLLV